MAAWLSLSRLKAPDYRLQLRIAVLHLLHILEAHR